MTEAIQTLHFIGDEKMLCMYTATLTSSTWLGLSFESNRTAEHRGTIIKVTVNCHSKQQGSYHQPKPQRSQEKKHYATKSMVTLSYTHLDAVAVCPCSEHPPNAAQLPKQSGQNYSWVAQVVQGTLQVVQYDDSPKH